MATKYWYVNPSRVKVTLAAGILATDIIEVAQVDAHPATQVLYFPKDHNLTQAEADFANGRQDAGDVPALRSPPPIAPSSSTDATQAQLSAHEADATGVHGITDAALVALKPAAPGSIASPTGGLTIDAESRAAIDSILTTLRNAGFIA